MTPEETRAQYISWSAGNLLVDRPDADPWEYQIRAAKAYDELVAERGQPPWRFYADEAEP
jgi:hypothetical protein